MGNTSKELAMTERASVWDAFYTELVMGDWQRQGESGERLTLRGENFRAWEVTTRGPSETLEPILNNFI